MSFLSKDAKADRLSKLPIFKNADHKALEHLANAADEVTVKAGTVLIHQGRHHHEGYVIESGTLNVEVDGEHVATIPAGQVVGELTLFGHGPATATVTAAEEVTALIIPHNRFDQILDEVPGFAKTIAVHLAARLANMDEQFRQ